MVSINVFLKCEYCQLTKKRSVFFRFASRKIPFECKDIEIALHEIRGLQDHIDELEMNKVKQVRTIKNLLEELQR